MSIIFIISLAIILTLADLYFYRAINHFFKGKKFLTKKIVRYSYWGLSVITIGFLIFATSYYTSQTTPPKFARTYVMGIIFIITISKLIGISFLLIYDIVRLLSYMTTKIFYRKVEPSPHKNAISRAQFLKKTAVITAAIPFGTLMYGVLKSAFDYKIHRQKLYIQNLPNVFSGLKIIQISDIHSGSFISEDPLKSVVNLINNENPDIVFFTGDLVNEISEEALPFINVLSKIVAPMGVYSILGNHDYGDYFYDKDDVDSKRHNYQLMKSIHKKMGWKLLLNENHIITKDNNSLAIIGVENWGNQARFQKYGDIDKAKIGCESCNVKMLLTHDPSHWEAQVLKNHADIDVTFSGHTHGMQFGIKIPGFKWSPSQYLYDQWAGLYKKASQQIYVNTGIGFIGYPGRVGILPEITVFELT